MEAINDFLVVKKEVPEEKRSEGGIIIESHFHHLTDFTKKNICYAEVLYANENIPFLKVGDRIVLNPQKGTSAVIDFEDYTLIKKEQFIAKIKDGIFTVPPDSIMVKIRKEDKDALYSKWILKNDGTRVQLFLQSEPDENSDKRSQIFVSMGEIVQVGENVKDVLEGDEAILDYTVDNFIDNVLYYDDEENKYVVIDADTTYHTKDNWVYSNRRTSKDTLVSKAGDMNIVSPLLGVIRGDNLIARQPCVFLNHKSNVIEKQSKSGIVYPEEHDIVEHEVLSVSEKSHLKYGIKEDQKVLVKEIDVFDVQLKNYKIQCIYDADIMVGRI